MDYTNKDSLKPLLSSIGMLGVATITSAAGGPFAAGAFGLAGRVVYDLLNNLAPNIASDQILKINPKKLRQYFTSSSPNLSNHDLYKGFKSSINLALDGTLNSYKNSLSKEEYNRYHIIAIFKRVELLKKSINNDFDKIFLNNVSDEQINNYVENRDTQLYNRLYSFLNIEKLTSHGNQFLPFVRKVLPSQILAAFTEILKNENRVWIAYQRLILTDIQEMSKETNIISNELIGKVNTLSIQLEMIQRKIDIDNNSEIPNAKEIEQLWELFKEAKNYYDLSLDNLDQYHAEINSKLNNIVSLVKNIEKDTAQIISYSQSTIEISSKIYSELMAENLASKTRHEELKSLINNLQTELQLNSSKKSVYKKLSDEEMIPDIAKKILQITQEETKLESVKNAKEALLSDQGISEALKHLKLDIIINQSRSIESSSGINDIIEALKLRIELLKTKHDYAGIIECQKKIIDFLINTEDFADDRILFSLHELSKTYLDDGQYELAQKTILKSLDEFSHSNDELLKAYLIIAEACAESEEYDQSFFFAEKVITLIDLTSENKSIELAQAYGFIGVYYLFKGKFNLGVDFTEKKYILLKSAISNEHIELIKSAFELTFADLYRTFFTDEAPIHLDCIKEYTDTYEEVLKNDLKSLSTAYLTYAFIYMSANLFAESKEVFLKCKRLYSKYLRQNHPRFYILYQLLGLVCLKTCKWDESISYFKKCELIGNEIYEIDGPQLGEVFYYLGVLYGAKDQPNIALKYLNRALPIFINHDLNADPGLSSVYEYLGRNHSLLDNFDEALKNYNLCLNLYQKTIDFHSPEFATIYNLIGVVQSRKGEFDLALKNYNQSISIMKQLSEEHPDYKQVQENINNLSNNKSSEEKSIKNIKQDHAYEIIIFIVFIFFFIKQCT